MTPSISTDKLAILGTIVDRMLNKLPEENVSKIKELDIDWEDYVDSNGDSIYLPTLNIKFYE